MYDWTTLPSLVCLIEQITEMIHWIDFDIGLIYLFILKVANNFLFIDWPTNHFSSSTYEFGGLTNFRLIHT